MVPVPGCEREAAVKHRTCTGIAVITCLAVLGCQDSPVSESTDLGKIDFPTSGSAEAQQRFITGALLLHSFEYDDAAEAFQQAQKTEPDFAMAYWGEALTHNHPLWEQQDAEAGREVLARLAPTPEERLAKAPTEREKDYMRTVEVLYGEGTKEERDFAYLEAMRQLAEKYPDDLEAASLHALATLGTSHDQRDFRIYMRAAALAEEVFAKNPLHPGAAHYLVHSYDDPVHAPVGLRAARVYAKIAPAAAHALHMPSHVFVSLGMWEEVAASNEDSWAAAEVRVRRKNLGVEDRGYHALLWLEYAYLQQGRYREARKQLDIIEADAAESGSKRTLGHLAALRAHYRIESRQWRADSIEVDTSNLRPAAVAKDVFVRGMSAVKTGDLAGAKAVSATLDSYVDEERERAEQKSGAGGVAYVGPLRGAEVMALELEALIRLAEGQATRATQIMQSAVAAEDELSLGYGPPYPVKPAHELFGEILLELDRAKEAQHQFERALDRAPRRALSLLGLARAAAKAGESRKAEDAYSELRDIWHRADDDVPGLAEVRQGTAAAK